MPVMGVCFWTIPGWPDPVSSVATPRLLVLVVVGPGCWSEFFSYLFAMRAT